MFAQVMAVLIFVCMFVLVVLDKIERHIVTLGCGLLVLIFVFGFGLRSMDAVLETLNIGSIFKLEFWHSLGELEEPTKGINWSTIIFIAGMMIMVEGMGESGFFRWLCLKIAKIVNYKVIPILITFMVMSAFLAMFIDSITVILFLVTVTIELAALLKFDPIPVIIAEIFCANLGGSATMCGDPPNIIIGTSLGYTFGDFIANTGVIALVSLIVIIFYFYFCFKNKLKGSELQNNKEQSYPDPKDAITDSKSFIISSIIFLFAVVMLILHAQTGFTVAFIGVIVAVITLLVAGKKSVKLLKKVDYKTILFFIGLFIVVGGLEETGILEVIAEYIAEVSAGNLYLMVAIIIWVSAIASAFVDNIPFAATMIPIIKSISVSQGVPLTTLAWTLAIGTDIGGSATPIGASANVVGIAESQNSGHHITWKEYCKYSVPASVIVIGISMVYIFLRYL